MSGNLWWDIVFWFFAIAGLMLLVCDIVRYFMYKNTLPQHLTVLIPGDAVQANCRASIANLLNLLYEQKPDGNFELIVLENTPNTALHHELQALADASDCVYVAKAAEVAEYVRTSF